MALPELLKKIFFSAPQKGPAEEPSYLGQKVPVEVIDRRKQSPEEHDYDEYPARMLLTNSWLLSIKKQLDVFEACLAQNKGSRLFSSRESKESLKIAEAKAQLENVIEQVVLCSDQFSESLEKEMLILNEKLLSLSKTKAHDERLRKEILELEHSAERVIGYLIYVKGGVFPRTLEHKKIVDQVFKDWQKRKESQTL